MDVAVLDHAASAQDKDCNRREDEGDGVGEDGIVDHLLHGSCKHKAEDDRKRKSSETPDDDPMLWGRLPEDRGKNTFGAHGKHHPRIAHHRNVDIGEDGKEHQTTKDLVPNRPKKMLHQLGGNGVGPAEVLEADDLYINQVEQKIKRDDDKDADADTSGYGPPGG